MSAQTGVLNSRAPAAYSAGATGAGTTIAFIDSGINTAHREFAGRIHAASRNLSAYPPDMHDPTYYHHGTLIAGAAAAARNGYGVHGVAYDSTILMLGFQNDAYKDESFAAAFDIARENGAKVMNVSFVLQPDFDLTKVAIGRASEAGMVIVLAAGNEGNPDPLPGNVAAAIAADGAGIVVGGVDANGAASLYLNNAGVAAEFFLMALGNVMTVDEEDRDAWNTTGIGTSIATPLVSGAAALLADAFPNLTGKQIAQILFNSADDAGDPGTDPIYGRGILNIARAFQPQGTLTVAGSALPVDSLASSTASEAMGDAAGAVGEVVALDHYARAYAVDLASGLGQAPAQQPLLHGLQSGLETTGAPIGPAILSMTMLRDHAAAERQESGLAGEEEAQRHRDRLVSGHIAASLSPDTTLGFAIGESGRTLGQRLGGAEGASFLAARDPLAAAGFQSSKPHALAARHKFGAAAVSIAGEQGQVRDFRRDHNAPDADYRLTALTLDRSLAAGDVSLGISRLDEERSVLGGRFGFAPLGSVSWFADAWARQQLPGGMLLAAAYRRGWTDMASGSALISEGRLTSDGWSLDLSGRSAFASDDSLSFRIAQPLRVRSGGYLVRVPVSYDYSTQTAGFENRLISLAPTGRELDFEAAYGRSLLGGRGSFTANGFIRLDPGHIKQSRNDVGAAARLKLRF